jgi:uncharacterized protein (TIGR02271 family)
MNDYTKWQDKKAYDSEGNEIGTIAALYCDTEDDQPTWATIKSGLFGMQRHFVPLTLATVTDDGVTFATTKDLVDSAPAVKDDDELTEEEEGQLFEHYQQSNSTPPKNGASDNEDTMTLSEERLRIDKEKHVVGRLRLRKYIVREDVHVTVPVEREVARLEREPITDANRAQISTTQQGLSEDEQEVVLTEQRVRVEKETVPVERVKLKKETIINEEAVNETVGKEKIDLQGNSKNKSF